MLYFGKSTRSLFNGIVSRVSYSHSYTCHFLLSWMKDSSFIRHCGHTSFPQPVLLQAVITAFGNVFISHQRLRAGKRIPGLSWGLLTERALMHSVVSLAQTHTHTHTKSNTFTQEYHKETGLSLRQFQLKKCTDYIEVKHWCQLGGKESQQACSNSKISFEERVKCWLHRASHGRPFPFAAPGLCVRCLGTLSRAKHPPHPRNMISQIWNLI